MDTEAAMVSCFIMMTFLMLCVVAKPTEQSTDDSDETKKYDKSPQIFRGMFSGTCLDDGIYYQDVQSFVQCAHGNSYVMPCSPGTQNDDFFYYKRHIGKNDNNVRLCDVNLVDIGYGRVPRKDPFYYYDSIDSYPPRYSATDDQFVYTYRGNQADSNNYDQSDYVYGDNETYDPYDPPQDETYRKDDTERKANQQELQKPRQKHVRGASRNDGSRDYKFRERNYRYQQ